MSGAVGAAGVCSIARHEFVPILANIEQLSGFEAGRMMHANSHMLSPAGITATYQPSDLSTWYASQISCPGR